MTAKEEPVGETRVNVPGGSGWYGRTLLALHAIGSSWTIALAVWITLDVTSRALFNRPLTGTAEIVAYSLPFATFLQIPYILRIHAHLRSPLFDGLLPERGRAALATLACLLGVGFFGLGAYSVWSPMAAAWRAMETVGDGVIAIPSGPLWTAIFTGCLLLIVQFLVECGSSLKAVLDPAMADAR